MKKVYAIGLFVFTLSLFTACHDFLSQYPKDTVYPSSTDDFNELLVGNGYLDGTKRWEVGGWLHLMDDDVEFYKAIPANRLIPQCSFYNWDAYPDSRGTWDALYEHILCLNVILNEIEDFKDEKGDGYRKVKGEAHFLRAGYYFFLTNLYGKPYRKSTAASDLGVPLKLSAVIEDRNFTRHTVQACYDQMVSDLKSAIICLKGVVQPSNYRASEMAAHVLLGRLYLYMGEWEACVKQCDTVLQDAKYRLLDFNTFTNVKKDNAIYGTSPETVFTTGGNNYSSEQYITIYKHYFQGNKQFVDSYDVKDLRRDYFFRGSSVKEIYAPKKQWTTSTGGECSDYFLLRLPEVYLNKAEALAMLERPAEAIPLLRDLRSKRFKDRDGGAIDQRGEDLVRFIRSERRFEFTFEGHRWFDLRRYAVSPKWPFTQEIRHIYYENDKSIPAGYKVLATYEKDPARYVLPLPEEEVSESEGALVQNEERKELPVVKD